MTKKDYQLLALWLLNSRPSQKDRPEAYAQWIIDVNAVTNALGEDNSRFSAELFRKACGYYE
jgi:hypothetical protein